MVVVRASSVKEWGWVCSVRQVRYSSDVGGVVRANGGSREFPSGMSARRATLALPLLDEAVTAVDDSNDNASAHNNYATARNNYATAPSATTTTALSLLLLQHSDCSYPPVYYHGNKGGEGLELRYSRAADYGIRACPDARIL
jgi:hypothetical protein